MLAKYPPDAYRGFRSRLPDWVIGLPTAADQSRVVALLRLRLGDCVLDSACGSGFNLARLVRAVGPGGLVIAVEDNQHLLEQARRKVRRSGWMNVQLLDTLDDSRFERRPVDGVIVSYNPPILLQRQDLLEAAWKTLKPGGRISLAAGRCTTVVGRMLGPVIKLGLAWLGHGDDWHYWTVHEPWAHLQELAEGRVWVQPRLNFQYLLWAEKPVS